MLPKRRNQNYQTLLNICKIASKCYETDLDLAESLEEERILMTQNTFQQCRSRFMFLHF